MIASERDAWLKAEPGSNKEPADTPIFDKMNYLDRDASVEEIVEAYVDPMQALEALPPGLLEDYFADFDD